DAKLLVKKSWPDCGQGFVWFPFGIIDIELSDMAEKRKERDISAPLVAAVPHTPPTSYAAYEEPNHGSLRGDSHGLRVKKLGNVLGGISHGLVRSASRVVIRDIVHACVR